MLKVQIFPSSAKIAQAREKFFRFKTRPEDFSYIPMCSRLPLTRVREVTVSGLVVGNRTFPKVVYHEQKPVRGALTKV